MTCFGLSFGDSDRGQGSRSDQALLGLSLTPVGIATHPRTGVLSADLRLKHLSAKGTLPSPSAAPEICEHIAPRAKNVVVRQHVNQVTS